MTANISSPASISVEVEIERSDFNYWTSMLAQNCLFCILSPLHLLFSCFLFVVKIKKGELRYRYGVGEIEIDGEASVVIL